MAKRYMKRFVPGLASTAAFVASRAARAEHNARAAAGDLECITEEFDVNKAEERNTERGNGNVPLSELDLLRSIDESLKEIVRFMRLASFR